MAEDRQKQTEAFAKTLDDLGIPATERPEIMKGVNLFFDYGWPSNHFTVGMAACAGAGLIPFPYEGFGSEAKYKKLMEDGIVGVRFIDVDDASTESSEAHKRSEARLPRVGEQIRVVGLDLPVRVVAVSPKNDPPVNRASYFVSYRK